MISATVSVLIGSPATNLGHVEPPPEQWLPSRCSSAAAGPAADRISRQRRYDWAPRWAAAGRVPTLVNGTDC